jgi:cytochrome c-type biogenesis protein CcmH/NrfG
VQWETVVLVALTTFAIGLLMGWTAKVRREVFMPATRGLQTASSLPADHPPLDEPPPPADVEEVQRQVEAAKRNLASIARRERLVQLGHQFFDHDQPIQAIAAYELALDQNDQDPDVWTDLGIMYRRVRWTEKAIECFHRALTLNPRHPQARLNLGIVLAFDQGKQEEALREWKTLLQQGGPAEILRAARELSARVEGQLKSASAEGPKVALGKEGQRVMVEMSTTFTALDRAAREANWEEVRHQVAKMETLSQRFGALEPIRQLGPMAVRPFQQAVEALRQAAQQREEEDFRRALQTLQERCNRCHRMMNVPVQVE